MGLFDRRKKVPDSPAKTPSEQHAETFDRYFETTLNYQQQKLAEQNAESAEREAAKRAAKAQLSPLNAPDLAKRTAPAPAAPTQPMATQAAAAVPDPIYQSSTSLAQQVNIAANEHTAEPNGQSTQRIKPGAPDVFSQSSNIPLVGSSSDIGRREYQQDALSVSSIDVTGTFDKKWLAVLCDGMGGMNGGERASFLCVQRMLASFNQNISDFPAYYRTKIIEIDEAVSELTDTDGTHLGAGSTFISIAIDGDNLYWSSVGDSHIYIIRGNEIVRVNAEHNYLAELLERVKRGEMTIEEAYSDKNREALTSYMGIGRVTLMDIIEKPFKLMKGDFVILCSDGLYRSVSDAEIFNIMQQNAFNMPAAAKALTSAALAKNHRYQDNVSVITVRYQ